MKGIGFVFMATAVTMSVLSWTPETVRAEGWCPCGLHADCDGCACFDNLCDGCCCCNGVCKPLCRAHFYNWNRRYAHYQYGQPVALVVPPTANLQTNWGWGVGSSRVSRLDHQFGRNYPGFGGPFGAPYKNTPRWPQDTNQFGVYSVRGPW